MGLFIPVCTEKEFSYNSLPSAKSRIIFYLGVIMGMDIIDRKLLELLQVDATMPVAELAQRVNLSQTPCWKRLQRLKDAGVIRAQVALCDARKLGVGTTVFVAVRTNQHTEEWAATFTRAVRDIPEVVEVYRMSGETDYLLRVVVSDIDDYDRVYKLLIGAVPLYDVSSSFAMEQIKYSTALPVRPSAVTEGR
jgi:Lrp/AsnC family transcriptional regulator